MLESINNMAQHYLQLLLVLLATFGASMLGVEGFSSSLLSSSTSHSRTKNLPMSRIFNDEPCSNENESNKRRALIGSVLCSSAALVVLPFVANAGIDPNQLRNLPVEGDVSGTAQRLREIEAVQRPSSDLTNVPFEELPSGVSYREYREGKGDAVVQPGSKVGVEMTIRCKSFATANEPGGLKYFSTKEDTDFNELAWTVGSGEFPPGLEEAMMGMHRNALRRIEIPSTQVFSARNANQLPLPQTKDGKLRFENLFKTDATLLFEVLVTRIK